MFFCSRGWGVALYIVVLLYKLYKGDCTLTSVFLHFNRKDFKALKSSVQRCDQKSHVTNLNNPATGRLTAHQVNTLLELIRNTKCFYYHSPPEQIWFYTCILMERLPYLFNINQRKLYD